MTTTTQTTATCSHLHLVRTARREVLTSTVLVQETDADGRLVDLYSLDGETASRTLAGEWSVIADLGESADRATHPNQAADDFWAALEACTMLHPAGDDAGYTLASEIIDAAQKAGAVWVGTREGQVLGVSYCGGDEDEADDECVALIDAIAEATGVKVDVDDSGGNGSPEGGFWSSLRFAGKTVAKPAPR